MNMVIDEATEQVHPPVAGAQANADGRVQENRNVWQDGDRLGMVVSGRDECVDLRGLLLLEEGK